MTTIAETLTGRDIFEGLRNLDILRQITTGHQHAKIRIGGKTSAVDMQTANALVTVHDALGGKGRTTFVAMLANSTSTFNKLVSFAWEHVS